MRKERRALKVTPFGTALLCKIANRSAAHQTRGRRAAGGQHSGRDHQDEIFASQEPSARTIGHQVNAA